MSLAVVSSRAQVGTHAPEVTVEVHLSRGLPAFSIVGLPETAVKESKDRVRGAILNSNFEFPSMRISVNLAPADLPKVGGRFDLPIALGVLAASNQIPASSLLNRVFLGELALSGELREISGGLTSALSLRNTDLELILPIKSAYQANLVDGVNVFGVESLCKLTSILNGMENFSAVPAFTPSKRPSYPDMNEIVGQSFSKYALEVAASGAHSMLMMGSPGSGKTMIAHRLPGILPLMNEEEGLETAAIMSLVDNNWHTENWLARPFRSPHHSASGAALIGGGSIPRPGEISLAHNGVLFLDELTEFGQKSLDLLREPMEAGYVNISRAALQLQFQSQFMFIGAANPCKCGYYGDPSETCQCTPDQVQRYLSRLSGPLLDRIDIQLRVTGINHQELKATGPHGESSKVIRLRVMKTRERQLNRQGKLNSELSSTEIQHHCKLSDQETDFLEQIFIKLRLSARGYHRILKLARTIADMNDSVNIEKAHLSSAVTLRYLDKKALLHG